MRVSLVMVAGGAGGLQQSIIPYAVALRHFGHDVQLVMNSRSPLLKDVKAHGFAPDLVHGLLQYQMTSVFGLRRHLSTFGPQAVIGFASKGYPVARRAARKNVPVFTRVGTMNPTRLKKLLGADALLVTSEEMRMLAEKLGASPSAVQIVPNFLVGGLESRSDQRRNIVRIGAMGRFMHRKGFDILLRAAHLLQKEGYSFELVIAGAGKEDADLRALAEKLNVSVEWLGWVGNEQKPQFFEKLDIFVCPSRDEPFGQVFLEAMRYGVPIVASDTVGARAIFTFGHNCRVCSQESPEDMSREISMLLMDQRLREKIGQAGADTFVKVFQVEGAGRQLCEAISTLLRNRS